MKVLILLAQLAATDVPCTVPVPENSGEWKQIATATVTFCIPAAWRVRGTRASYSGGSIRWQNTSSQATARTSGSPQSVGGVNNPSSSAVRTESIPEMIGGRQAFVMRQMGVGRLQTSVSFRQPPEFSITGEAAGEEHALLQLDVYRTVRFINSGG